VAIKRTYSHAWLAAATLLLLLIAASRIFRLQEMIDLAIDEMWSVWQTFGTPEQIWHWTPYDWPPLYFLLLAAWRALVGIHPILLRYFSLLVFMLASAIVYRLMRRLGAGQWAALLGILTYAASGYTIFASVYVRGYMLVALYAPLALWLTMRYFSHPTFKRALPLGVTLAAMFWTTLSMVGAFFALGCFSLIAYRKQVWRWWLPGVVAGMLALPEILNKATLGVSRIEVVSEQQLSPLFQALGDLFVLYTGNAAPLWAVLVIVATVLLFLHRRFLRGTTTGVLAWLLTPLILYAANSIIGLFFYRYMLWVMIGLALWVALGLALLPRAGQGATGILLVSAMFLPIPLQSYEYYSPPIASNLVWLADHIQPGDVVLLDPNCACHAAEKWDYYGRVYFPGGIHFVEAPEGYRRVWYVTWQSRQDAGLEARVNDGRLPSIFVGPPENLIRLYEGPPDAEGIRFANGVRFHGLDILDTPTLPVRHEGEAIDLRLWWSTDTPLDKDYSITIQVFSGSRLMAQVDGPALVEGVPLDTSRWTPGKLYVDERTLSLPFPAEQGIYNITVAVYQWWDNVKIAVPGADENGLLPVGRIYVKSW